MYNIMGQRTNAAQKGIVDIIVDIIMDIFLFMFGLSLMSWRIVSMVFSSFSDHLSDHPAH